jgi:hypothetical protein
MLSFLPLVAMEGGMSQSRALASASILLAGDAALQFGIGWLADHLGRRRYICCAACWYACCCPAAVDDAAAAAGVYLFVLGGVPVPSIPYRWPAANVQRCRTAACFRADFAELECVQQPGPGRHRPLDAACRFGLDGGGAMGHRPAVCAERLAATRGHAGCGATLSACQHADFFVRLNFLMVLTEFTMQPARPAPRIRALIAREWQQLRSFKPATGHGRCP